MPFKFDLASIQSPELFFAVRGQHCGHEKFREFFGESCSEAQYGDSTLDALNAQAAQPYGTGWCDMLANNGSYSHVTSNSVRLVDVLPYPTATGWIMMGVGALGMIAPFLRTTPVSVLLVGIMVLSGAVNMGIGACILTPKTCPPH